MDDVNSTPTPIWDVLEHLHASAEHRSSVAIISSTSAATIDAGPPVLMRTYSECYERICKLSSALVRITATKHNLSHCASSPQIGVVIGVMLHNSPEVLELHFAAARVGAVVLSLNTRMTALELQRALKQAHVACLVAGEEFRAVVVEALRDRTTIPSSPHDEQTLVQQGAVSSSKTNQHTTKTTTTSSSSSSSSWCSHSHITQARLDLRAVVWVSPELVNDTQHSSSGNIQTTQTGDYDHNKALLCYNLEFDYEQLLSFPPSPFLHECCKDDDSAISNSHASSSTCIISDDGRGAGDGLTTYAGTGTTPGTRVVVS
jgi:LysM repeat protein